PKGDGSGPAQDSLAFDSQCYWSSSGKMRSRPLAYCTGHRLRDDQGGGKCGRIENPLHVIDLPTPVAARGPEERRLPHPNHGLTLPWMGPRNFDASTFAAWVRPCATAHPLTRMSP